MSQSDAILSALRRGEKLTPGDALVRYGCFRLAARIYDLEQAGHEITTRMVKVAGRDGQTCLVAEYSLAEPGELFAFSKSFEWA